MKSIKFQYFNILLICCILMGVLPSCKKSFLDKNPPQNIFGEEFWKSEADVNLALTGVYQRLQSGFFGYRKSWLDAYSDNAYEAASSYGFANITRGDVEVTSNNVNPAFYNIPYEGISSCNYFLDNIDKAPVSDSIKTAAIAEVRFLRAFFYFDLVQSFGGVIIYKTAPKTVEDAKIKQSSKEETLAFIHEDLDFAIANLPDALYAGHAVKASAQAVKAKVFLVEKKWSEAAALTNEIIESGKFSIYQEGYQDLFLTATQQNNPEIIFSTKYLAPYNIQNVKQGILVDIGWLVHIQPYQNLVDEYEMKNGKMINEAGSGYDTAKPYVNRDPRLDLSIKLKGENYINPNGSTYAAAGIVLTGYVQEKYMDFTLLPWDRTIIIETDMNTVHVRYADILLMYAEAKNETSGPDASIYNALDLIRARKGVDMPPVDRTVHNNQEKLRDFIRHERRVELALEGHRYFDLKRWGLMEEKLSKIKNPAGIQLGFSEKNNVLPFPFQELDLNPQLDQNDGYD